MSADEAAVPMPKPKEQAREVAVLERYHRTFFDLDVSGKLAEVKNANWDPVQEVWWAYSGGSLIYWKATKDFS